MLIIINYFYAIIIGFLVTFPIGPGGLLCVQRTVKRGMKVGYLSAIGFIISDLIYGFIVLLASNFLNQYVKRDNLYLNIFISAVFIFIGLRLIFAEEHEIEDNSIHPLISGFIIGILNPGTIFVYMGIFHFFPIHLGFDNFYYTLEILLFIFLGSNILWFILTELIIHLKKLFTLHHFFIFDKIIGLIVSLFGIINLLKIILKMRG